MWLEGTSGVFSENRFRQRTRSVSYLVAAAFSIIVLRLFFLQVVRGDDFAEISESNRTQILFLRAPRGDFYDRRGQLLISNRPSWSVMYSVTEQNKMSKEEVEKFFAPLLDPLSERWRAQLKKAYQTKQMVRLVDDVPNNVAFGVSELGDLVPGARMEMEFRRGYTEGLMAAHVIGYLGEIDERELRDETWDERRMGDFIGKTGLERIMDRQLRGRDGGTVIEVDSAGRLQHVIKELPYEKGNSLMLTLDKDVQKAAAEGLDQTSTKRGAAIAIDVRTGDVLAWVSAPAFRPGRSLQSDIQDRNLPMFDRVYKGAYPPGSLFKLITAIAGWERKEIHPARRIYCPGYLILKDKQQVEKKYRCWKIHGQVDYWRAVSESCDVYFYLLGQAIGSQSIFNFAREFGFGETVQSILPNENAGVVPNALWKKKRGLGGWSTGDTYNMSIGQGFVTSTPLQLAVMMMGMANRGAMYQPNLVEKVVDNTGSTLESFSSQLWHNVTLNDTTWTMIHQAMRLVISRGTGKVCDIPYLDVRGKTGTAQNPHGEDHSLFGAFAGYPGEPPAVAVVVFVENGGSGSAVAGPIARRVLEAALPPRIPPEKI